MNNPLIKPAPSEIPLARAPLIRVIAQVGYPTILSINKGEFVAPFQDAIRNLYPILRSEKGKRFSRSVLGEFETDTMQIWRFINKEGTWRVSITPSFVALETTEYKSRTKFLERFSTILTAVHNHFNPTGVERLGLRYVDRLEGINAQEITRFIRPEVVGILSTDIANSVELSISESIFNVPQTSAQIRAQWGFLPPKTTIDPTAIEPIEQTSWVLDLDMFDTDSTEFEVEFLREKTHQFAERLYTLFRWMVTDEFLTHFGGNK